MARQAHLETGAILGGLVTVLALTGLSLSPSVGAALGVGAEGGWGNALYAVHLAAAALLVAFTAMHLWPIARSLARKAGVSAAAHANSWLLFAVIVVEIATGIVLWLHAYQILPKALTAQAHLIVTALVVPPIAWHAMRGVRAWRERQGADRTALAAAAARGRLPEAALAREGVSRRAALRILGYSVAGVALAYAFGKYVSGQLSAWRLNYIGETPRISKESFTLKVTGLVGRPLELSYAELLALGTVTRRFTHHCVEGWSYTDSFTGVPLARVFEAAGGVRAGARMVILRSPESSTDYLTRGQRYTTNFPHDASQDEDHLIVVAVGGEDLPAIHGGPVRLMSPVKWGYKACKWLEEIELSPDAEYQGYWERLGYHNRGDLSGPIFA